MAHERVEKTSASLTHQRLDALRALIPEAFREGKPDLDALRAALGEQVGTSGEERYTFGWAGKRDAMRLAQTPTRATLIPVPDESMEWETTQNLFIEGDNLEALKLLARPYFGRVKMIYIDPPYNTGNDFVYPDNYADPLLPYLQMTGQADAEGNLLTTNSERNGRFHSRWLSMIYPRLLLARQLLREDGVIFVSIDDNEVHNLRLVMDQVFGEENYLATLIRRTKAGGGSASNFFAVEHDYIVVYARQKPNVVALFVPYDEVYFQRYGETDEVGSFFWDTMERSYTQTKPYTIEAPDGQLLEGRWFIGEQKFYQMKDEGHVRFIRKRDGSWSVQFKQRPAEGKKIRSIMHDTRFISSQVDLATLDMENLFSFPKPVDLLFDLVNAATKSGDIILDFFSGSSTTAHAVMQLNEQDNGNRRFIMIQFPEPLTSLDAAQKLGLKTIADVGKERIRRVIRKIGEQNNGKLLASTTDLGFRVFRLAPTHYRQWQDTNDDAEFLSQTALFAHSLLLPGWQPLNVIYEVALKEGYGLNIQIEEVAGMESNSVYRVHDPDRGQTFHICLDETLPDDLVIRLKLKPDDLFICLDGALDDTRAMNFALRCTLKTL
jgi:adenine-specific DNA-methyltransferase